MKVKLYNNSLMFALDEFIGVNQYNEFINRMEKKYPNGQIPINDPEYIKFNKEKKDKLTEKEMHLFFTNALELQKPPSKQ